MAKLCKAGQQLREQIDDLYPQRDRKSDGWIADSRHFANKNSDHIPNKGIVRAIDIDANLNDHPEETYALVEKIRKCAKRGDKRIKYIIFDKKIMSPILNWKRRPYKGSNPHRSHFHISFTGLGDKNGSWFDIEGDENVTRSDIGSRGLVEDLSSSGAIDLPSDGMECQCHCCQRRCCSSAQRN